MKNGMVVGQPEIIGNIIRYHYEITGPWQEAFTDMRSFEIQYSMDVSEVPSGVAVVPFLANVLPISWVYDAVVETKECDEEFYHCVEAVKESYSKMYPMLDFGGALKATKLSRNRTEHNEGAIAFFSGGVDSYDTLLRHKDEKLLLMSLWGADISLESEDGFQKVETLLKETALEYGAEWVTVKSGFREFVHYDVLGEYIKLSRDNWWHGFQHGIGIIAHSAPVAYLMKKKTVYLASSLTAEDKGVITCASDPDIDNQLQFCGCSVWHDGYDYKRQQKVEHILQYAKKTGRNIPLRVCWETQSGKNCCKCEKCFRTMLEIYAEGYNPEEYGFVCSKDDWANLSKQVQDGKGLPIAEIYYPMYYDIQNRMREKYTREEVMEPLRWFYDADISQIGKKRNRTLINVACSVTTLVLNLIISFFLSPYIVENIGVEANGFVVLANNFVIYGQLIVTALNSMAARYITMSYAQKDYKKAQVYYNSVFWGNLIIVAVLILPATLFIVFMELLINIPPELVTDVKILFSFVFFNFFIGTAMPNWDCGTYATNRLDRMYVPVMTATVFRSVFLFIIFMICVPKVWYVGLAAALVCLICLVANAYNTHTLTPELKIILKRGKMICSKSAIKELVGSGIWNSASNAGVILLNGLDLLVCNIMLGPVVMGVVTLSKMLVEYISQMSVAVRDAFAPGLTIHYGKGDMEALLKEIKRAMKITSVLVTIPVAGVIVLGGRFFALWVPSQDAELLHVLACISVVGYVFTGGIQILYAVFPTVNKVKENAIAVLISGVVSIVIMTALVYFTDMGIWAVMIVSEVVCLIRNMSFTVPATAKYLGVSPKHFYAQVGITVISTVVLVIVGFGVTFFIPNKNWVDFMLSVFVMLVIGCAIQFVVMFRKQERREIFGIIRKKLAALRR